MIKICTKYGFHTICIYVCVELFLVNTCRDDTCHMTNDRKHTRDWNNLPTGELRMNKSQS